jgi:hydrogenase 3 maturation protease
MILGIGNTLRGDDALGPFIIQKLKGNTFSEKVKLIDCGSAPEAFTHWIKRYNPSHIILVDVAHLNMKAGMIKLISADRIGGLAISTHNLPLSLFSKYIQKETEAKIILLAVQPKKLDYNTKMTPELRRAVEQLSEVIQRVLRTLD